MADIVMKETEPDQAFVQKGQHILIRMPSGNVKMVGLKPKTYGEHLDREKYCCKLKLTVKIM
jgi:hypothetical protein